MRIKLVGLFLMAVFFMLGPSDGFGQIHRGYQTEWQSEQLSHKLRLFKPRFSSQPIEARVVLPAQENWFRNFKVEIINISDKPIYFAEFFLSIPELVRSQGGSYGIVLRYGNPKLIGSTARANHEDKPIKPGDKSIIQIPAETYQMYMKVFEELGIRPSEVSSIELLFKYVNFGDGTSWQPIYKNGSPFHAWSSLK